MTAAIYESPYSAQSQAKLRYLLLERVFEGRSPFDSNNESVRDSNSCDLSTASNVQLIGTGRKRR